MPALQPAPPDAFKDETEILAEGAADMLADKAALEVERMRVAELEPRFAEERSERAQWEKAAHEAEMWEYVRADNSNLLAALESARKRACELEAALDKVRSESLEKEAAMRADEALVKAMTNTRFADLLASLAEERLRLAEVEAALETARGDCAAQEADGKAERAQAEAELMTLRATGERAVQEANERAEALFTESHALRARLAQLGVDKATLEDALAESEARFTPVDVIPQPQRPDCRDVAVQASPSCGRPADKGVQTDGPGERDVIAELQALLIASEQGRFEADLRLEEVLLEAEKQRLQGLLEVGQLRRAMDAERDNMDQLARDLEGTFETLALTLAGGGDE